MNDPEKQPETIKPADKDIKPAPASAAELPGISPANTNTAAPANGNMAPANTNEVNANGHRPAPFVAPAAETPATAPVAAPVTNAETPPAAEQSAKTETTAPVAATPAEAAPAEATPAAEAPAAAAPAQGTPHHSRGRKIAMAAFNMAAGCALSVAAKTATVAGLSFVGAPALAVVLASSVAVGAVMTGFCHFGERHALKKQGHALSPLFSKAHAKELFSKKSAKVFVRSGLFAFAGGLIGMGVHEGWFTQVWNHFAHHAPAVVPVAPAVVPPVAAVVPIAHIAAPAVVIAPVHCATPTEAFADLIKGHHVSPAVTDALHRAASHNAHIAAQGTKDMAFYAQNGFDGVPKDAHVATELFKQAADAGNTGAKVDLLYMQHYGLDTIAQNKAASLSAMKDIAHNARAETFVEKWGGAGKTLPHVNFDTNTILKGVKLGCPTA